MPFALTGGLYLLWLLHYNFSVAVWVGFIALFGTAVQTTVVMVIYLEEAVERKRHERGNADNRGLARSRDGGGATPPSPEAHDGLDHRGGIVADFLEQPCGIGGDTTSSHASPRRHAQFARTRADRHTHHFHVAA